jgi:hypothetical protein
MKWYERLNADPDKYYGPLGFVNNHQMDYPDSYLAKSMDSWMEKWDGKQNWLECLLENTYPEDTVKLLFALNIYPKRIMDTFLYKNQVFLCSYMDVVYYSEDDVLEGESHTVEMSSEDWKRLVKAKSIDNDVWKDS